ncbi:hypothetical protein [Actinomadura sp. WMMA1423]|uniref:hypothetical protein n=1 Tax=Actinomadura sp. WMMA1423 TaxID=2591108 RepID=UPI0034A28762
MREVSLREVSLRVLSLRAASLRGTGTMPLRAGRRAPPPLAPVRPGPSPRPAGGRGALPV